jgi:hypothetical protein
MQNGAATSSSPSQSLSQGDEDIAAPLRAVAFPETGIDCFRDSDDIGRCTRFRP